MLQTDQIWLTLLVFLPSVFALALIFFPKGRENAMCWWSLAGTALTLGVSIAVFINYKLQVVDRTGAAYTANLEARSNASLDERSKEDDASVEGATSKSDDWVARTAWIPRFNIDYYLGIDGISLPLILLTTLISFLAMIASFNVKPYEGTDRFMRGYCMLFLILETGMLGTFVALDFFLFYVFWEVMLLPMYFLIGVWGGQERLYAAIKFFLYTLLGSVFILIALLGFYFTNARDFVTRPVFDKAVEQMRKDNPSLSEADAQAQARVNSFDLVVLARAGKAALQYIDSGHDITKVTTPVLQDGRDLRKLKAEREAISKEKADNEDARAKLDTKISAIEKRYPKGVPDVDELEKGLKERLDSQWFFTPAFQYTMFVLLFIGFAIKVPVVPFHTWLPDAHVQAPTPISMILAGVLLKMGGYGILRIAYPICPWAAAHLAVWLGLLGVISIVYGAFAAMAQDDFKKLVAYSSVSHMGYVLLGIAVWGSGQQMWSWAWGVNGAMFQMIAHGITSAGMFFCVGVIYDRAHHRNLDNFRGLYEPMPLYSGLAAVIFFGAMGLPGMCGFVGEFMVVLSTWNFAPNGQHWVGITFAVLAALTVVLTAGYILWTVQRVYLGTNPAYRSFKDITWGELCALVPLVVLAVLLGVLPSQMLLAWMEPSVTYLVDTLATALKP